ncbi:hypothetical protein D9M70_168370 [compost metagenome]
MNETALPDPRPGGRARRGAAGAAALLRHPAQLHRPLHPGGARPGAADRRRRHDQLRPGRLRWPGCLHQRLPDHGARPAWLAGLGQRLALADAAGGPGSHRRGGPATGRPDPEAFRPLSAARHHRLGPVALLPVRHRRIPRRPHRGQRPAVHLPGGLGAEQGRGNLLPDLGGFAVRHADHPEPPRLPLRPRHPRPQGRPADGRIHGREHLPRQAGDLPHLRPVRRHLRLALRPHPALREPHPLRPAHGHRLPVHGADRRRGQCLGRAARRRCADHAQAVAAGPACATAGQHRQL